MDYIMIVARSTAVMRSAVITEITDAEVEVLTDTIVDTMMIDTSGLSQTMRIQQIPCQKPMMSEM